MKFFKPNFHIWNCNCIHTEAASAACNECGCSLFCCQRTQRSKHWMDLIDRGPHGCSCHQPPVVDMYELSTPFSILIISKCTRTILHVIGSPRYFLLACAPLCSWGLPVLQLFNLVVFRPLRVALQSNRPMCPRQLGAHALRIAARKNKT